MQDQTDHGEGCTRAAHHMKLMIPKGVRERLIIKDDDFAQAF
jgi:hypothetical protein